MVSFLKSFSLGNLVILMLFFALVFACLYLIGGKSKETKRKIGIAKKLVVAAEVLLLVMTITVFVVGMLAPDVPETTTVGPDPGSIGISTDSGTDTEGAGEDVTGEGETGSDEAENSDTDNSDAETEGSEADNAEETESE